MELFHAASQEHDSIPDSSQAAYVHDLLAHTATIPEVSRLPRYFYPSAEEQKLISLYCKDSRYGHYLQQQTGFDIPPLHRPDIIEPDWACSVKALAVKASGIKSERHHWYRSIDEEGYSNGYGDFGNDPHAKIASRKWELAYIGYARQRRVFHANFMTALLTKSDITDDLVTLETTADNPHMVPAAHLGTSQEEQAPDFMFNKTNWLVSSLLSVLALPPEKCDASMKHHAIKLFAKYADLNDKTAFENFYRLSRPETQRLPWGMRTGAELQTEIQPRWRQNPLVQQYFGPPHQPIATAMAELLEQRPKDYVQLAIMRIFREHQSYSGELVRYLSDLAATVNLPPETQAILYADDAAFNTVYGPPALPGSNEPQTLIEFLEAGDATEADWKHTALEQRLRIQNLESQVAAAISAKEAAEAQTHELKARLEAQNVGRIAVTKLFGEYGLADNISDDVLEVVVTALRRNFNKRLRLDSGHVDQSTMSPETAEQNAVRLKKVNNDLDEILRSRGLWKNKR